ncbi:MAG: hypothetical protein M1814_000055 [Vezdaea aestivalis]|nr:MAG: hypothetical protein M1814_000055 [Vezdaea aestivalis]
MMWTGDKKSELLQAVFKELGAPSLKASQWEAIAASPSFEGASGSAVKQCFQGMMRTTSAKPKPRKAAGQSKLSQNTETADDSECMPFVSFVLTIKLEHSYKISLEDPDAAPKSSPFQTPRSTGKASKRKAQQLEEEEKPSPAKKRRARVVNTKTPERSLKLREGSPVEEDQKCLEPEIKGEPDVMEQSSDSFVVKSSDNDLE